jgi:hypothetical protein
MQHKFRCKTVKGLQLQEMQRLRRQASASVQRQYASKTPRDGWQPAQIQALRLAVSSNLQPLYASKTERPGLGTLPPQ